ERLPPIIGDADDLLILFVNLIKNAVEAGDRDRPNVLEVASSYQVGDRQILVSVSDSGIGMDEERLRRIWTPLETGKAGGTGLGMKVIQRIVEEHDGEIHVTSTPGVGTRVEIRLPVDDTEPHSMEAV